MRKHSTTVKFLWDTKDRWDKLHGFTEIIKGYRRILKSRVTVTSLIMSVAKSTQISNYFSRFTVADVLIPLSVHTSFKTWAVSWGQVWWFGGVETAQIKIREYTEGPNVEEKRWEELTFYICLIHGRGLVSWSLRLKTELPSQGTGGQELSGAKDWIMWIKCQHSDIISHSAYSKNALSESVNGQAPTARCIYYCVYLSSFTV